MPRKANEAKKAAAIEGVRWYFSDDRAPPPPAKPFWLTYVGDDVVTVAGVGKFANGTRANVDAATAEIYRADPAWVVEALPPKPAEDED